MVLQRPCLLAREGLPVYIRDERPECCRRVRAEVNGAEARHDKVWADKEGMGRQKGETMKETRFVSVMRSLLRGRALNLVVSLLVAASVVLLFVIRLAEMDQETLRLLEITDYVIIAVFTLEFLLKLVFLGRHYFFRDFGWIDLLACLPILSPLFLVFQQLQALRMARLIRFVRLLRLVRLFKMLSMTGEETRERIKTRFYLAITSVTMIVILAGAVTVTFVVDRFLASENLAYHRLIVESLVDSRRDAYLNDNTVLYVRLRDQAGVDYEYGAVPSDEAAGMFGRTRFLVFPEDFADATAPLRAAHSTELRVEEAVFSNTGAGDLIDGLELVIMATSLVTAGAIIFMLNRFLSRSVTNRLYAVIQHIDAVFEEGQKLPMPVDDFDDEITDLEVRVNRITDIHII